MNIQTKFTAAIRRMSYASAFTIIVGGITATLIAPSLATASISVDQADKVKLFGDVRLRVEADDDKKQNGTTRDRARARYRARFGTSFKANDQWSGKLRLSTGNGMNSPHRTFSTAASSGTTLGFDQAYVAFTGVPNLTVIGGKTGINFWQQNEVFWDTDISPEALAAVYQAGLVTLNAAYVVVADGKWDNDDVDGITAVTYQAIYGGSGGDIKYTLAAGGATVDSDTSEEDGGRVAL